MRTVYVGSEWNHRLVYHAALEVAHSELVRLAERNTGQKVDAVRCGVVLLVCAGARLLGSLTNAFGKLLAEIFDCGGGIQAESLA